MHSSLSHRRASSPGSQWRRLCNRCPSPLLLALTALLAALHVTTKTTFAQETPRAPTSSTSKSSPDRAATPFTPPESFQRIVTELAREHLPAQYEKTRNWGRTTPVLRGLDVSRDGLQVRTKRKWKEVNDGAWQRYRIEPIDPDANFEVRLLNGQASPGKFEFDLWAIALLRVEGRHAQWERGVQLFSVNATAQARVELKAHVEVDIKIDAAQFPPAVTVRPRVVDAELNLVEFKLERVSDLHGPLVKSLSSTARDVLEDKIDDNRQKLVDRLNASLDKRRDKFTYSGGESLRAWLPR